MKNTNYREVAFHYVTPFLAGFVISMYGHWNEIGKAFCTPMFYVSFIISIAVSALLMFIVRKINTYLNKIYPWERNIWIRTALQIVFGLGLTGFLELLFFAVYFIIQGQNVLTNDFIYYDFPLAMGFIGFLNIYYISFSHPEPEASQVDEEDYIYIKRYGKVTKICISKDVLYVKRSPKGVHIFTMSGTKYSEYYSLSTFLVEYGSKALVQINRSVLINTVVIEGYQAGSRYGTLELNIKPEYRNLECMRDQNLFVVTGKEVPHFKEKFTGK